MNDTDNMNQQGTTLWEMQSSFNSPGYGYNSFRGDHAGYNNLRAYPSHYATFCQYCSDHFSAKVKSCSHTSSQGLQGKNLPRYSYVK